MLLELLFKLTFGIIGFIINLIPNFEIDLNFTGLLAPVGEALGYLDMFVSVNVILTILGIVFLRDNFVFLKNIILMIYDKIPFI
ncbi:hypothetical protein JZO73_12935 [Enterococcus plantarum]|uniref:hypothetical protein n=1 Tax=Enterococcus plantarum TaxID=1077675 RepID=UPI001A8E271B|nr:hypothetical protein [Enterococcus plantarum]MBO0468434.1 hypothetical protein [Enterococcus plantarum]